MASYQKERVSLGDLIVRARTERGISRSKLAELTGISENSLVKYEKAGVEDDGQYPPSPKLASICAELLINPIDALLSCLPENEASDDYMSAVWNEWIEGHPGYMWALKEIGDLDLENRILLESVRVILFPNAFDLGTPEDRKEITEWAEEQVKKILVRKGKIQG